MPSVKKFVTVCDKGTAIFSNFRKLPIFGVMAGEPVFKRFRRVFFGAKKMRSLRGSNPQPLP